MLYSLGDVSKLTGKPITTLRYWEKNEMMVPVKISKGKKRFYSREQLINLFGELDWSLVDKKNG